MCNLTYKIKTCPKCGGRLSEPNDRMERICEHCREIITEEVHIDLSEEIVNAVNQAIDDELEDRVAAHRRALWDELQKDIKDRSSMSIRDCAVKITTITPDDIQANFYLAALHPSSRRVINFLNKLTSDNVKPNLYRIYVYNFVEYLTASFEEDFIIPLRNLVSKCFETYSTEYNNCQDLLDSATADLKEGTHNVQKKRDVFIACSSKDKDIIWNLVQYLESPARPTPLKCFFYERNLPQGRNAEHHYQERLETAISNCTVFLFASSKNSRCKDCDAYRKELLLLDPQNHLSSRFESKERIEWIIDGTDSRSETDREILKTMKRVLGDTRWHVGTDEQAMEEVYNTINRCIEHSQANDTWESGLDKLLKIYDDVMQGNKNYVQSDVHMECQRLIEIIDRDKQSQLILSKREKFRARSNFYERANRIVEEIGMLGEESRANNDHVKIKKDIDELRNEFARFIIYNEDILDTNVKAADLETRMRGARGIDEICNLHSEYEHFQKMYPYIESYGSLRTLNESGIAAVKNTINKVNTVKKALEVKKRYDELSDSSYERSLYTKEALDELYERGVAAVNSNIEESTSIDDVLKERAHYDELDKDSYEYSLYTDESLSTLFDNGVDAVYEILSDASSLEDVIATRRYFDELDKDSYLYSLYTNENLSVVKQKESIVANKIFSYIKDLKFTGNVLDYTDENNRLLSEYNASIDLLSPTDVVYTKLEDKLNEEYKYIRFKKKSYKNLSIIYCVSDFFSSEWSNQTKKINKARSKINDIGSDSAGIKIRSARATYFGLSEKQKLYLSQDEKRLTHIENDYEANKLRSRKRGWRISVLISWIISLLLTGAFLTFLHFNYIEMLFSGTVKPYITGFISIQFVLFAINIIGSIFSKKVDYDAILVGEKSYSEYDANFGTFIVYPPFLVICFAATSYIAMFLTEGITFNQWATANAFGSLSPAIVIAGLVISALILGGVIAFLFVERDDKDEVYAYGSTSTTNMLRSRTGRFFLIVTVLVAGFAAGSALISYNAIAAMELKNYDISEYEYADNLLYQYSEEKGGIVVYPFHRNKYDALVIPEYIDGEKVVGVEKTPIIKEAGMNVEKLCEDSNKNIKKIQMANSVKYVGDRAFEGCESLTQLELSSQLTTIGERAFAGCKKLESITLPSSIKTIGKQAFYDCGKIRELTIPSSVTEIGHYAFSGANLQSIILESSCIKMELGALGTVPFGAQIHYSGTISDLETLMSQKEIVFPSDSNTYVVTGTDNIDAWMENNTLYRKVWYYSGSVPEAITDKYVEINLSGASESALSGRTISIESDVYCVKFKSNAGINFDDLSIMVKYRTKPLEIILDDFNYTSVTEESALYVGAASSSQINLKVLGRSSISCGDNSGNAIYARSVPITISGSGKLTLNGGNGTNGSAGGAGIDVSSLTIAMTGSLVATGGAGGNGIDSESITSGGTGGTGGAGIKCSSLTIEEGSTVTARGGAGGTGGTGGEGAKGSSGYTGNSASENGGWYNDASDGGDGYTGGTGYTGGKGGTGGVGIKVSSDFTNNSSKVTAIGGAGGQGGKGGTGGQGGTGGKGGDDDWWGIGTNAPGDGGDGGTGGKGGTGGMGGNRGESIEYYSIISGKTPTKQDGALGTGGAGGDGGSGGLGGSGGDGGTNGGDGRSGSRGGPGSSGDPGSTYTPI